jgi:hypothetical protein
MASKAPHLTLSNRCRRASESAPDQEKSLEQIKIKDRDVEEHPPQLRKRICKKFIRYKKAMCRKNMRVYLGIRRKKLVNNSKYNNRRAL